MIHQGKGINKDNIIGIKQNIFPEDDHIYEYLIYNYMICQGVPNHIWTD